MLILDAEIYFDLPNEVESALQNDLDAKGIIRPGINFGNDCILTGTVIADKTITRFIRGRIYKVMIEMPLIDNEAYNEIYGLLKKGNQFPVQIASRKIGRILLIDWIFE